MKLIVEMEIQVMIVVGMMLTTVIVLLMTTTILIMITTLTDKDDHTGERVNKHIHNVPFIHKF